MPRILAESLFIGLAHHSISPTPPFLMKRWRNWSTGAYFNPRPINVGRAEFNRRDGKLRVFMELRDINYPGSTYSLEYDSASDRLKGTNLQAVEKQTFVIEFVRTR